MVVMVISLWDDRLVKILDVVVNTTRRREVLGIDNIQKYLAMSSLWVRYSSYIPNTYNLPTYLLQTVVV